MQLKNNLPRPEHLGWNVSDPTAVVDWYCTHLGMRVMRHFPIPTNTYFIVDSGGRMMLEFYKNNGAPLFDFPSLSPLSFHLAFMSADVQTMRDRLTAVGAVTLDDIAMIPGGDQILMMRDPWGLAIQFVQRARPMLMPQNNGLEHFAVNIPDPQTQSEWYCRNLHMKVLRSGPPPTHTTFLADAEDNMLLEIYSNHVFPMLDWKSVQPLSIHLAFSIENIPETRDLLLSAGASLCEDHRTLDSGDQLLMLRDPWGIPIQFVNRSIPML